jgi:hypothetical protein
MAFVVTVELTGLQFVDSDSEEKFVLYRPVVELANGDVINIYDNFGKWERKFRLEDFDEIEGAAPADLGEAYDILSSAAANSRTTSSGGLPAGAATSANQVTQIAQGTGAIQFVYSEESLPYTVPAGAQSYSITTQGSVSVDTFTVPAGSVFSASHPSQDGTVLSPNFTDVAAGSLLVTLGIKV